MNTIHIHCSVVHKANFSSKICLLLLTCTGKHFVLHFKNDFVLKKSEMMRDPNVALVFDIVHIDLPDQCVD